MGHNVDMMAGIKTGTHVGHAGGQLDRGHKVDMMAVTKTGDKR